MVPSKALSSWKRPHCWQKRMGTPSRGTLSAAAQDTQMWYRCRGLRGRAN